MATKTVLSSVATQLKKREKGAISEQIEKSLRRSHSSISAALSRMEDAGFVKRTTEKRQTTSGRNASVYVLTKAGYSLI